MSLDAAEVARYILQPQRRQAITTASARRPLPANSSPVHLKTSWSPMERIRLSLCVQSRISLFDNVARQANAHDVCTLSPTTHSIGFMIVHFNETLLHPDFPADHHDIPGESTATTTSRASVSIRWRP